MIAVENMTLRAGAFRLEGIGLDIPTGGYGVLMGKTGSGKTTILEAICGLRPVAEGRVRLRGRDVTGLRPAERGIGYVPQDRALFSTLTVRGQLAFALEVRKWPRAERDKRVEELAALLGLGALLDRFPRGLSGGEAQRVALGRALSARPEVLCLDEPLTALDDETREEMISLLRSVRKHTGVTAIHVTHSRDEARRLADKVFLLAAGHVRELPLSELEVACPERMP